jgi:calmodulin-binding transcription activator
VSQKNESNSPPPQPQTNGRPSVNITDFSPEWAYPEGGVKVLVTGPWHSDTSSYTVLFDTFPVPTTLVQSGVLRCYCPG